MPKFRKKPVMVEAMQYTGNSSIVACREWGADIRVEGHEDEAFLVVVKASAMVPLVSGMWIIKERDGVGCYPCIDSEFQQTYGNADDGDLLYEAWGVIANVSQGNWDQQNAEWREAATRWRDRWHATLPAGVQAEEA